jgi:5,5'-dehydrodivanillate O-demethylase oxygenase subunit
MSLREAPVADRRSERLGRSDSGIVLLRKLWSRELRSLAAGRPMTNWVVPPVLLATTGL